MKRFPPAYKNKIARKAARDNLKDFFCEELDSEEAMQDLDRERYEKHGNHGPHISERAFTWEMLQVAKTPERMLQAHFKEKAEWRKKAGKLRPAAKPKKARAAKPLAPKKKKHTIATATPFPRPKRELKKIAKRAAAKAKLAKPHIHLTPEERNKKMKERVPVMVFGRNYDGRSRHPKAITKAKVKTPARAHVRAPRK